MKKMIDPSKKPDKNISSAEMTAVYRSAYPELSQDSISRKLASEAGVKKAFQFMNDNGYPLIQRKISLRAGYMLNETNRLLATGKYDSCISFASGFSLLTYCIGSQNPEKNITYFDTDLPSLLATRNERLRGLQSKLDAKLISKLQSQVVDLEEAAQTGKTLQSLFPTCKRPIFLIEGVIYFLSETCVNWLIHACSAYETSAIVMDYWPDDMLQTSRLFKRLFPSMDANIPEKVKSFFSKETLALFEQRFSEVNTCGLIELDQQYSQENGISTEMDDPNEYFPLRLLTASN